MGETLEVARAGAQDKLFPPSLLLDLFNGNTAVNGSFTQNSHLNSYRDSLVHERGDGCN